MGEFNEKNQLATPDEIYGPKNEVLMATSKLQISAELAKRYPFLYLHVTTLENVPDILNSGHVGANQFGNVELYTQPLIFMPDRNTFYKNIEKNLMNKEDPSALDRISSDFFRKERLGYFLLEGNDPAVVFSNRVENQASKFTNERLSSDLKEVAESYRKEFLKSGDEADARLARMEEELALSYANMARSTDLEKDRVPNANQAGTDLLIQGFIDLKDARFLICMWIPPIYRGHLLRWISTWTDEKRQEVFGDRKPEEVLISSVKDLPPLEK